jgi:diguanylate cyclase (GGDEF)-like protein
MALDGLPEHVVRPIHTAHVAPALRALFARLPSDVLLAAELPADAPAPLALLQLVKLALHGGPPELGNLVVAGAGEPACVSLVGPGGRVFEARGEAIGHDARALVRRALPALLDPALLAAIADDLAGDASKRATMQHVVRAMLEAKDVHEAVHAMLTGITSGDCLAFHRAALFVRDRERAAYIGSQAVGPRDISDAHRIWEEIEVERKSIASLIEGYARHEADTLQLFVQSLTLRPGDEAGDEVSAAERAERGVVPFLRERPVNQGLAALGAAREFVLAAVRPHGEVLGLIFVDDVFGDRAIGAERVRDLELFVGQAALVWENTTLLERVASLAQRDGLTGLVNRRELEVRFASEASRARRSGAPCGLLIIDVDHFKAINDSHGHERGDDALRRIAALLQGTLRAHDTAARYGGDEFVVVLPGTPRADVSAAARRIGRLVGEADLSVSIGAATWPDDCAELDELFSIADGNLYRAKRAGRGRACMSGGEPFGFDAGL